MKDKLKNLEEKHQIEKHKFLTDDFDQKQRDHALMILGGVRVADKIADSISSQVMRALITFREEQRYLSLGHENFADFLDKSDYSPMSKATYYRRKEIFDAEGEKLFDLMNEVGVSMATRKLLAAANYDAIEIDGDTLKIGDETADLSNARLVRTLIESYADDCKRLKTEAEKKSAKIEALNKQIETGANQYQKLAKAVDAANGGHPHDIALMRLLAAFHNLRLEAEQLSKEEKSAFAPNIFAEIAAKLDALSRAYNRVPKSTMEMSDEEREKFLASKINDDELADLMD